MKVKEFVNKSLGESSIHGFPYLVRRELHWIEKICWALIVVLAAYFSVDVCLNQWKRFRENPVVYATELPWGKSNFPFVGTTLCSRSTDPPDMERIIQDNWHVNKTSKNITQYQYYMDFLKVLNSLNFLNLENLYPYGQDSTLMNLKLTETAVAMRQKYLPKKIYASKDQINNNTDVNGEQIYAAAMTEFGVCRTTSQMTHYTNPYGDLKSLRVHSVRFCNSLTECNAKIIPKVGDEPYLLIFLHNVNDIVAPYEKGTILRNSTVISSMTIELLLNLLLAEAEVRNLPIAYRKCRYKDENNLKFFETYRPSLCRMECRIKTAMQLCNCKPYFYVVAPHLPVCNIKGMICLAKQRWPQVAECNCPNLCEEESYVGMQSTTQTDYYSKFESTVIVKLFLPRTAIKRRVVFSQDQLFMSFGGAIGLFLGASLISIFAILYVLSECVLLNILARYRNKKNMQFQKKTDSKRGDY